MLRVILTAALLIAFLPAYAKKNCEELKTEIANKLDAKGVKNYELNVVATAEVTDQKVVGSCDGGNKKITYQRN